jgi:hypothetical protein
MARHYKTKLQISALLLAVLLSTAPAQLPTPTPSNTPPRNPKFVELKANDPKIMTGSADGRLAIAIRPEKWKAAETDNFIIHYRRMTEAQKVGREIEFNLWFVAKSLGVGPETYAKKSHVFVFEDAKEWKTFLASTSAPPWSYSFAYGDELFLNIRGENNASFDSGTLAHEATHAVVARIYPGATWPIWLNEGFAEYMSAAAVAARKNQTVKRHEDTLRYADLPLDQMFAMQKYPDEKDVHRLYQSSEKFVRFLFTELPADRFVKFANSLLAGQPAKETFLQVYGDKIKDWDTFLRLYAKFTK